ncbi:MFS transporter [Nitratireductor sp. GCM10026969]|uniref:MFS transporter n=1 Tax=Nitratireductor sp. GCM10026969 TaxID=3252645 RepID=UPI003610E9C1
MPHFPALIVLLAASTLGVMAGATIVPVLEAIRTDLGVSGTAAGLIITAHGLAIAVTSPIAGWMVDRWGVRGPMVAGLLVYGIAGGAGMFISSYPVLIGSRFVFGVGTALLFAATSVAMLSLFQGPVRDRVMGWRTAATSIGGLIFPFVAGVLATLISWQAVFGIYMIAIPIGVAAIILVPETQRTSSAPSESGVGALVKRPALLGVYAFMFALAVMMYSVAVFLPQRLAELGITAPIAVSYYMVAMAGSASLTGLFYGWLRARASYVALLRMSSLCWVAAFAVLGTVENPLVLATATFFLGIGNGIAFSTLSIVIADLVPESLLGRATGASSTLMFIGQFASPLVVGPLMAATAIITGYLVIAVAACLILFALLAVRAPKGRAAPAVAGSEAK